MLDQGDTVPFISRYRSELTGSMESEELFKFEDRLNYLRNLQSRKESIIKMMKGREQLTPELEKQIREFDNTQKLEEFYKPFIPREDSPATKAKEKGLQVVADVLFNMDDDKYDKIIVEITKEKGLTENEVVNGATDIIYEEFTLNPELKEIVRDKTLKNCVLQSTIIKKRKEDKSDEYKSVDNYSGNIHKLPSHKVLAIFRGAKEKQVKIDFSVEEAKIKNSLAFKVSKGKENKTSGILVDLVEQAYDNNIKSYIESEIKKKVFEKAEDRAIEVFAKNLRNVLMQKPVKNTIIMGLDPGYNTGCKLAVIDETGKLIDTGIIRPNPPHNLIEEAEKTTLDIINKNRVKLISIGNGTATQESELFIKELINKHKLDVEYVITSEQGASIYSASKKAIEEFPDLDIYFRSAVSIARRVQDPLSELIKIDPKSIGVGQYQHDLSKIKLKTELDRVIITCVNSVGVDINTASIDLLQYVSGLNRKTATNIIAYRKEKGFIKNRDEIKHIKGIGEKTYNQCVGFLKIYGGEEPLDEYMIHPDHYEIAREIMKQEQKVS